MNLKIENLLRILTIFKNEVGGSFSIDQLMMFFVSANNEGIETTDLGGKLEIEKAVIISELKWMGEWKTEKSGIGRNHGYDLIEMRDGKCYLTAKGRGLLKKFGND